LKIYKEKLQLFSGTRCRFDDNLCRLTLSTLEA